MPPRSENFDTSGILRRLRRRKAWLIGTFVLVMGVSAAALSSLPRSYRAASSVVIADNGALVDTQTPAQAARIGDPADLESQILLLRSVGLLELLLDRPEIRDQLLAECRAFRSASWLELAKTHFLNPVACEDAVADRSAMLERLEGGFAIGTVGRSRVIEVSFTSPLPSAPVVLTNALVNLYLKQDLARKIDTRGEAAAWLRGELARTGEDLRRSEIDVETYRREHGILRGEQATISSERLSGLSAQLVQAEAAAALASSRLQGAGDGKEVLENRTIADLRQQLAIMGRQRAEIVTRYGPDHPAAIAAARSSEQIQNQITAERQRVLGSLQRDQVSAEARVADLRGQVEGMKAEVALADGATAAMATLVRNVEVKRELFVDLSKRLSTMETDRRLVSGDARLVSTAQLPSRPWFPKRGPFLIVATILSAVVAVAVALIRDRADTSLRSVEGLGFRSGVPMLGRIPRVGRRRAPLPVAWRLDQPSDLQDAIRSIYARTLLAAEPRRVLLVTSGTAGEGKTFLALALARFSAAAGLRVLIVECDLRRPSIRSALKIPGDAGLSEHLRGTASLDDILHAGEAGRPDVIHAGRPAVDSTELLSKPGFRTLLRTVQDRYDLVLIDSPPTLLMPDARILASCADGVVMCASWAQSQTETVAHGIDDLRDAGANVLGIVIGMVREREYPLYGSGLLPAGGYPTISAAS
ncbi:Tyrosine-protein kinase (capsular polysaccharide biosynthesis) (plasmid) [Roseomonas mucosa]|uniref:non-specific protein-tyrosine kinase n=1 Tax=Roseomonas mucosa TaxID=207340 RepID=A0A1S8D0I6_9PROT|nr:polysaccharide biosynthesis tyrosine autokinase [Roseomonas mucosa]AWV20066.1 Tyrosine-protein kinase (capsular polysaccharide biosynthesis) [Roseomonas mucosa]MDT8292292.1 polysaccharide biosynthesis tyrosine autokinase [Roseomonas mucosa]MDT8356449.1 polysaccharide biosynthesis tyrosine autokinase [Roseomonas mucosa]ONH81711.1 hypothetical protein APZ41_018405 [Roseomonas mucosa]QDD97125.1 Tyrosine-protein kinase (capsular polysaccharide biosynthesis) [Roseomonas mucosa]